MNINWSEGSTKRGAVWVLVFVVGLVMLYLGRAEDIDKLLLLAAGVAGGIGVMHDDKPTE